MSKSSNVYQKIAKNIRDIRKEKGLTQEELAFTAGLNRAYVGYIERGERRPSVETLFKIASSMKVKLQDLFIFD